MERSGNNAGGMICGDLAALEIFLGIKGLGTRVDTVLEGGTVASKSGACMAGVTAPEQKGMSLNGGVYSNEQLWMGIAASGNCFVPVTCSGWYCTLIRLPDHVHQRHQVHQEHEMSHSRPEHASMSPPLIKNGRPHAKLLLQCDWSCHKSRYSSCATRI